MIRTEVRSRHGNSHLGPNVFNDGLCGRRVAYAIASTRPPCASCPTKTSVTPKDTQYKELFDFCALTTTR